MAKHRAPRAPLTAGEVWWAYVRRYAPGDTPPSYAIVAAHLGMSRQRVGEVVTGSGAATLTAEWVARALSALARHGWPPGEVVLETDGTMTIRPTHPRVASGART